LVWFQRSVREQTVGDVWQKLALDPAAMLLGGLFYGAGAIGKVFWQPASSIQSVGRRPAKTPASLCWSLSEFVNTTPFAIDYALKTLATGYANAPVVDKNPAGAAKADHAAGPPPGDRRRARAGTLLFSVISGNPEFACAIPGDRKAPAVGFACFSNGSKNHS